MSRIVIALGGNALGNTAKEQLQLVTETAKAIVDLIEQGNEVVIAHGNGPQVGMINLGMSTAAEAGAIKAEMPFPECGAMSQGYIGYDLQNALREEMLDRNIDKGVATVLTQVEVAADDPAFADPVKPIGPWMSEAEAKELEADRGYQFIHDEKQGFRRVVASPKPVSIVELDTIKSLVESNHVVISCGGGGIPVTKSQGHHLKGAAAVIDKDFAAEKLAEQLDADALIILTAVEKVYLDFGKPTQKALDAMTVSEARAYMEQGQFAPGSMLPKVQACVKFVEAHPGGRAVITSLDHAAAGLRGETGTLIVADEK